jgi:hypothetical protein
MIVRGGQPQQEPILGLIVANMNLVDLHAIGANTGAAYSIAAAAAAEEPLT